MDKPSGKPMQGAMMSSASEVADLLPRVAAGDRQAFERLYGATSLKLFGIVLRILHRRELAEEVLQDVYVRIWNNARDFRPEKASPITWMATIARNRAVDVARRRPLPVLDDPAGAEAVADSSPSADARIEASESLVRLEECLAALGPPQGDIVRAAYLDGCSRQELADRFQQPVGTIKSWLHRSLKQLKECLDA